MTLSLLGALVLLLVVAGFVAWLIGLTPIEQPFKQAIQGLILFVCIITVVWAIVRAFTGHPVMTELFR